MSYNDHKSYNAWNVSLWINNDEGLFYMAKRCAFSYNCRDRAARRMMQELKSIGVNETPDGVPYTKTNIRLAMVGL